MTSFVPLFIFEKLEFEDKPPRKSQITGNKSEKNNYSIFYQGLNKSYFLFSYNTSNSDKRFKKK